MNRILIFPFSRLKMQPIHSQLQILGRTPINHDCYIYNLKWADTPILLNPGQHYRIIEKIPTAEFPDGEEIVRKYVPISPCNQQDSIQLLVKMYGPNVDPNFPQGRKLTNYIDKLSNGDKINVSGPYGSFSYQPGGVISFRGKSMVKKRIFLIAGGTGVVPCYQTIRDICSMPDENIQLILLYANKTEEDIVLRKQLEDFSPKLKIHYTLESPPENWKGHNGYPTKQMLESICPLHDPDTLYCLCGPGAMNTLIQKIFTDHYPNSSLFKY